MIWSSTVLQNRETFPYTRLYTFFLQHDIVVSDITDENILNCYIATQ